METPDRLASFRTIRHARLGLARRFGALPRLLFMLLLSVTVSACTPDNAQDLFENGQLEERQNNQAHAKQLYQEILTKYPKSEYARKAEERLRDLELKK